MENSILDIINDIVGDTTEKSAMAGTSLDGGSNTTAATTGSHSSEQCATIKNTSPHDTVDSETEQSDEGSGNGVNTPTNALGGISATPTGEDVPSTTSEPPETDKGTSHPVKNASAIASSANELLAMIAVLTKQANTQEAASDCATKVEGDAADGSADDAEEAGEKEASATPDLDLLLGALAGQDFSKQAATQAAVELTDEDYIKAAQEEVELAVKTAEAAADSLISFLIGAAEGIDKEAMDELAAAAVEPGAMAGEMGGGAEHLDPETAALLMELLAQEEGGGSAAAGGGEEMIPVEDIEGHGAADGDDVEDASAADVVADGATEDDYKDEAEKVSAAVEKMAPEQISLLTKALAARAGK